MPDLELIQTYNELFTRKYRKSVWKSYAEYNLFFGDLTTEETQILTNSIRINSKVGSNSLYGVFNNDWNEEFKKFGIKDVIWVNPNVKMKNLNADRTLILLKDNTLRLKDVSIKHNESSIKKLEYFYLYYSNEDILVRENLLALIKFLKDKARDSALKP